MNTPSVDILIPSYRPGEKLVKLLEMLGKQELPVSSVRILNTEEEGFASAAAAVKALSEEGSLAGKITVSHIRKEEFDHAGARNRLVRESSGEMFVLMTDDAVPAGTDLTKKLAEALCGFPEAKERGITVAAAYARQLAPPGIPEAERFQRSFSYPEKSLLRTKETLGLYGIRNYFLSDVCAAYRRDIFLETGGFREPAVFNEDMVFAHDAMERGFGVVYAADAAVYHAHDYTAGQQLRRNFDLGMSQALHPEVFGGLRSEGEGLRLVRGTASHLLETGRAAEIPRFLYRTAFRYLGFRLGKAFKGLPESLLLKLTGSPLFVKKYILQKKEEESA